MLTQRTASEVRSAAARAPKAAAPPAPLVAAAVAPPELEVEEEIPAVKAELSEAELESGATVQFVAPTFAAPPKAPAAPPRLEPPRLEPPKLEPPRLQPPKLEPPRLEPAPPVPAPRAPEPKPAATPAPPADLLKGVGGKPLVGAGEASAGAPRASRWTPVRDQVKGGAPADASLAAIPETERPKHVEAKKIARLLVSEIKLYNEAKVAVGRKNKDLYERLKEDIERSRKTYLDRVDKGVAAKTDYFRDELVATLAEGDPSALGVTA
jgi:hypothetical protein